MRRCVVIEAGKCVQLDRNAYLLVVAVIEEIEIRAVAAARYIASPIVIVDIHLLRADAAVDIEMFGLVLIINRRHRFIFNKTADDISDAGSRIASQFNNLQVYPKINPLFHLTKAAMHILTNSISNLFFRSSIFNSLPCYRYFFKF